MNRVYEDNVKEAAYENACDCLYYGYGKQDWNNCGLSDNEAKIVWNKAYDYMSKQ